MWSAGQLAPKTTTCLYPACLMQGAGATPVLVSSCATVMACCRRCFRALPVCSTSLHVLFTTAGHDQFSRIPTPDTCHGTTPLGQALILFYLSAHTNARTLPCRTDSGGMFTPYTFCMMSSSMVRLPPAVRHPCTRHSISTVWLHDCTSERDTYGGGLSHTRCLSKSQKACPTHPLRCPHHTRSPTHALPSPWGRSP